jgi:hypothetical protein
LEILEERIICLSSYDSFWGIQDQPVTIAVSGWKIAQAKVEEINWRVA